jgi:hypothetical protein
MLKDCRQLIELDGTYELLSRSTMLYARLGHSACTVGDIGIVVTGTRVGDASRCEYFDINTNFWVELPKLNQPRHYHSSCSFNAKQVYVFAGVSETENGK